jgi:hypothetical protein
MLNFKTDSKGLTYDSDGNLYIVDSGSNRIVLAQDFGVVGLTGSGGMALGQFNNAINISVGKAVAINNIYNSVG